MAKVPRISVCALILFDYLATPFALPLALKLKSHGDDTADADDADTGIVSLRSIDAEIAAESDSTLALSGLSSDVVRAMQHLKAKVEEYQKSSGNSMVLYTVITGGYNRPCRIDDNARESNIDRFLLTDNETLDDQEMEGWHVISAPNFKYPDDAQLFSRVLKIKPFDFLKSYKKTLYIDGNVEVTAPVSDLFKKVGYDGVTKPELAIFSFPRNVMEEASWVEDYMVQNEWASREDARSQTQVQALRYAAKHKSLLKRHPGTFYGKIILRSQTKRVKAQGRAWLEEFINGVRRDQLSFRYTAIETKVSTEILTRKCEDTCLTFADPGFTRWFKKIKNSKISTDEDKDD